MSISTLRRPIYRIRSPTRQLAANQTDNNSKPNISYIYIKNPCSILYEGPVEVIAIIRNDDRGFHSLYMSQKSLDKRFLFYDSLFSCHILFSQENKRLTSLGSLNIVNCPSYSGLGVYSNDFISSEIISLLTIRNP